MAWHQVAQVGEIAPGKPKIVSVSGKEIGVFWEGERYFAVLNYCPHFGAPVCLGQVFGAITSDEPGQQSYDASRPILCCPWHRWEFDLETGQALTPIKQRLRTYDVRVENDGQECPDSPVGVETFELKIEAGEVWVNI